jgi:hypothetical protein
MLKSLFPKRWKLRLGITFSLSFTPKSPSIKKSSKPSGLYPTKTPTALLSKKLTRNPL